MPKIPTDRVQDYYCAHGRENFAANQRLEGIETPATAKGVKTPLPSKEQLRKKYAARVLVASIRSAVWSRLPSTSGFSTPPGSSPDPRTGSGKSS